jgi:hypothetical protein
VRAAHGTAAVPRRPAPTAHNFGQTFHR